MANAKPNTNINTNQSSNKPVISNNNKSSTQNNKSSTPNNKSSISNTPNSKINAPSENNTSKKSIAIENNTSLKNANNSTNNSTNLNTILETAKESAGVYEVVSENYLLLLGITSALVIIIIIYFFSQSFRVSRTLAKMIVYQGYQQLTSLNVNTIGNNKLGSFYVASAYNAAHCGYQMYDYTSEQIVLAALQSGARYLEFNVFNSEFGDSAYPVVSMGYKLGEWKMMVNDTPLETIFQIIAKNAFTISDGVNGVGNPDDPIFIGLNLNTNSNLSCLNLIAFLITEYFSTKLLDNQYSFQNSDKVADINAIQLSGKVVFFASDGFQGSGLEEMINYSWDNVNGNRNHMMRRIYYNDIMATTFDSNELLNFNKSGLTIVVPHQEGDFFNGNFDTNKAFDLGCQFISMEYQYIDSNMDSYITRFKNTSLVLKDDTVGGAGGTGDTVTTITIPSDISKCEDKIYEYNYNK